MLSCSGLSAIVLHNNSCQSFDSKISAIGDQDRKGPIKVAGFMSAGDAKEVLRYYANAIRRVDLEVIQLGSARKRTFLANERPDYLLN